MGDSKGFYSDKALELAYEPVRLGGMEDADAVGRFTDGCGDILEIFLRIESGKIIDASFLSDGCGASIACGSAAVQLAIGMKTEEAKQIFEKDILGFLGGLPESDRHPAKLWATTLQDALRNSDCNRET